MFWIFYTPHKDSYANLVCQLTLALVESTGREEWLTNISRLRGEFGASSRLVRFT